jgi:hypothetical protein
MVERAGIDLSLIESLFMEKSFQRSAAICLLFGILLMIATMVLHPSGGSIEQIVRISSMVMISHSLAILSIPFLFFGFYGLSVLLLNKTKWTMLALSSAGFALVAVMLAGSINGIVLPMYALRYAGETGSNLEMVKRVVNYGFMLNKTMDYIFVGGFSLAQFIWSLHMIHNSSFPRWMGWLGVLLVLLILAASLLSFNLVDLLGFRIYVLGTAAWLLCAGGWMGWKTWVQTNT